MKTRQRASFIVGIDEVGRGALAGPVTVAAACLPKDLIIRNARLGMLKDSKKLSAIQREKWFACFKDHSDIHYKIARVYPRGVDTLNISGAANRAATLACNRLIRACKLKIENCKIFLDGGLFLEDKADSLKNSKQTIARTVIRGDEKIVAVAIASVIAKVNRDKYMERLSKKYPRYGFEIHKGYGTKNHFSAIRKYGVSKMHRLTFLRKHATMRKISGQI